MNCSSCGEAGNRLTLTTIHFGTRLAPLKITTCNDVDACRQRRSAHETRFWGSPFAFAAALWSGRIRRHAPKEKAAA